MATAFQDVLTKLSAQKAALDGQMKAVQCLEATRETLADLGFDAAVSAKEGRLRLEVRLEAVRALPAPEVSPSPPVAEDPPPPPPPAPSVPLVKDAPPPETVDHTTPDIEAPAEPSDPPVEASEPDLATGPFSDAEFDQLVDMHLAGKSAAEIAAELGRKPYSVHNKLRNAREEIEARQRERTGAEGVEPDDPEPPEPEYVTGPFSDAEKAVVAEMAREGAEASAVAAKLGRNTAPVVLQMRRALAQAKPAPSQAAPPEAPPVSERHIDKHLDKLGYADGWTSARDLQLAEIIVRGDGVATAGAVLRVKSDKAKERWFALNTKRGDIDHQACLMRVLRHRANDA